MIFDQIGDLAKMKRHDYLPFGEELFAGTGGRSEANGYGCPAGQQGCTGDSVRQQFTAQVQIEQQPNGAFYDVQLRSLDPNRRLMDIKSKQDAVVKSGNTNLFMVQGNQIRMDDANRNIT